MTLRGLAVAVAAALGMSGTAHAAFLQSGLDEPFTVDFRGSPPQSLTEPADFGLVTVTSTGDKNDSLQQGPAGLGVGPDPLGLGDEIDGTNFRAETVTLTFQAESLLRSVSFNLAGDDGIFLDDPTGIEVSKNGSSLGTFQSFNAQEALVFAGGERVFGIGDTLTFSVRDTGFLNNDSYAIAGLSEVPLPAAAWLMIGGLGAVGALGRYGRKKVAADGA
jgi:hypothetical protein